MFDSVIEDIDLPLYKYGLIHRHNINNYLKNKNFRRIQQFKFNIIIILIFMCGIRSIIYANEYKNTNNSLIFNDIMRFMGGIIEYNYMIVFIASLAIVKVSHIFNYSNYRLGFKNPNFLRTY